jgi:hypothetical protein
MMVKPLKPPTTEQLVKAFEELVTELVSYRIRQKPADGQLEMYSAAEMCATDEKVMQARDWASSPVNKALKHGIHKVGQLLFERLGSLDALRDVVEDVAERDERYYGMRIGIMDSALNMVGEGDKRWVS